MTVSPETYEKAADVLDERGWWRHGYVPAQVEETGEGLDTCPVCVTTYPLTAGDDVSWLLGDRWNDRRAESVEQVTGALRAYAAELKAAAA